MFDRLPDDIRDAAVVAFMRFREDPAAPSLRLHELKPNHRGKHIQPSWSVSITRQYRAVFFKDGDTNVWYWIGSHSEYNSLVGSK